MTATLAIAPPAAAASAAAAPTAATRAWTVRRGGGWSGLTLETRPVRAPVGAEVLVRVRAVALNHRDLMLARGDAGPADRVVVAASDAAGDVIAVGPEVTDFRVGDRVVSSFFPDWVDGPASAANTARALGGSLDGVLAQQVLLPQQAWVAMPAHLDYAEAATLPCAGVTAWHALFGAAPARPGEAVLLLGTGGVSVWALQLAKAAGLRVLITSSDDAKLARARALGADATINYRRTPEWERAVLDLAPGGVDRVLEVGGPDTLARSLAAARAGGTLAVVGRLTGTAPVDFDPAALFLGLKRMLGVMVGSRAMAAELARFVAQHRLHPVIDRRFAFDEAAQAYEYLDAAGHFGKVVIVVE